MSALRPQSSMSCLPRCRSCSSIASSSRAFTTSTSLRSVGPESPRFIDVPLPPQRYAAPPRNIKGTLPPPRNLFSGRKARKVSSEDTLSQDWLATTTPEPSAPQNLSEPKTEYIAWKRRLAATRRSNLREGLTALHERKVAQEKTMEIRSWNKKKERRMKLQAPQREDERLTSPTITAAMRKLQVGHVPDPDRETRVAESAARLQARELSEVQERQSALHTLYMKARNFITTSEQLDTELERVFVEFPYGDTHPDKDNIWDAYGVPPTVQDMLATVNNTQKTAIQFHALPGTIDGKRMKKIAEELTGGTLD